jgi:HK97 family phage prohead protease
MELIKKHLEFEIKSIDPTKRQVTFYFAKKNAVDYHGDIFQPQSITFDPNEIRHFKNHDLTQLVGKIIEIGEDDFGFYAVSKILPTTLGNDTLIEYQEGAINQHSVGGFVLDYSYDLNGNRLIKQFRLLEVSTLTSWAAQPDTPVISIKEKNNNNSNMNEDLILKKIDSLENGLSKVDNVSTEVIELKKDLTRLNEAVSRIALHSEPTPEPTLTKKFLKKSGLEIIKDSGIIPNKLDNGKRIELEVKSIIAPYADGNNSQDTAIRWIPQSIQPYIHTMFDLDNTDSSEINYSDITSTTLNVISSATAGCFNVAESDLTITAFASKPITVRAWTSICDAHIEDYPLLLDEIDALLRDALINQFDAQVITSLLTTGTPGTTTPSFTALSAQVNDATLADLALIHIEDIIALTRARLGRNPVLFLHPTNVARLKTTKTDANMQLYGLTQMMPTIVPTLHVPTTQYILADRDAVQIRLLRNIVAEIKPGSHAENASGTVGLHLSMRGHIIFRNVYSGGVIFGTINSEISNYNQP